MSDCHWTERTGFDYMGYRMRTSDYSVTQWVEWDLSTLRPLWNKTVGYELYDHQGDNGKSVPTASTVFHALWWFCVLCRVLC